MPTHHGPFAKRRRESVGRQQKTVTFREWLSPFSDGQRVKAVEGSEMILFVGSHYEVKGSEITKYYLAGATRVAVRKYTVPASSELTYLLGDHLGSTSLATDETGALLVETRYKAWGEVRYTTEASTLPTRYTYTGQYSYVNDEATDLGSLGFGLMYYGARFYAPSTGRFSSADTIIPEQSQGTQAWDRYAYVSNNPIVYLDDTGHDAVNSNTITFSSASTFVKAAQKAAGAIDFMRNIQSKLLIGGATLVGAIGVVGGTIATGGHAEAGVALGGTLGAGAYALGAEMILDQYDQDLQNLIDMQSFTNGLFADGATEATMTITETQVTLNDSALTRLVPVSVTVQTITICSNLGTCNTYTSSYSPSNQHAIDRFFTPIDESDLESETTDNDNDI